MLTTPLCKSSLHSVAERRDGKDSQAEEEGERHRVVVTRRGDDGGGHERTNERGRFANLCGHSCYPREHITDVVVRTTENNAKKRNLNARGHSFILLRGKSGPTFVVMARPR